MRRLYGTQVKPRARIIQGVPASWEPNIATTAFPGSIHISAWSPCSQFIAIAYRGYSGIVILDTATLAQLHTMPFPNEMFEWDLITFSPDSHLLTGYSFFGSSIITWDLQTGGLLSNISTKDFDLLTSMTYSRCGTIIGGYFASLTIITFNVLSGTLTSSHSFQQPIFQTIWTDGEHLQFATIESESITIWQASFTSTHTASKVGSLSTPEYFSGGLVLLPAFSRLAFTFNKKVLVWDGQHHKVLLEFENVENVENMYFSSDGCFFVCSWSKGSYLWKEYPDGYLFYQKFEFRTPRGSPQISPNGQSVVSVDERTLQLFPIASSPASLSSSSTHTSFHSGSFFIEFSPAKSLVAFSELLSKRVTILDIKSGNPWLIINTEAKVHGLRMTGDKIITVSVSDGKIVTWDLPARDSAFNAGKNIRSSVQTTFQHQLSQLGFPRASVSPDLNYVVTGSAIRGSGVYISDMHTGEKLGTTKSHGVIYGFTPSSHEVWCARDDGEVDKWEIVGVKESNAIEIKELCWGVIPESGFPWHSPCTYQVTDEGWILCPSGEQLLWLPHHWRQDVVIQRKWCENLLAFWNTMSPEPYILELKV